MNVLANAKFKGEHWNESLTLCRLYWVVSGAHTTAVTARQIFIMAFVLRWTWSDSHVSSGASAAAVWPAGAG